LFGEAIGIIVQGAVRKDWRAMAQEQPARIERRLSAILAADVAGYSRLMHNDEEATQGLRPRHARLFCRGRHRRQNRLQLHALKEHYKGKLKLTDVKEMFLQMRDQT
jgi:hypothetical protein